MAEPFDGKSILIVDDDNDILTAMELAFRDTGATITTASDGHTATVFAQEQGPDLMILDEMMPKRSGLLVLQIVKAKKPRGSKPYVIMITGNGGKRHQQCAEIYGADDYINKPFRMDRLLQSAEKLLAKG